MSYVYCLLKSSKLVYVGKCAKLEQRISAHKWSKDFDEVLYYQHDVQDFIDKLEVHMIFKHKPFLNVTNTVSGELLDLDETSLDWKKLDSRYVTKNENPLIGLKFTEVPLHVLGKDFNGVFMDIEAAIVWATLVKADQEGIDLGAINLRHISTLLALKKDKAASILQKLIKSGVVKAVLEVKNSGVSSENKERAPKVYRFTSVKEIP